MIPKYYAIRKIVRARGHEGHQGHKASKYSGANARNSSQTPWQHLGKHGCKAVGSPC